MRRSRKVQIALVAGLAVSGCGRKGYDPCAPQTFNEAACQNAINHNGYYFGGRWYPHSYSGSYSAYYTSYHNYVRGGGSVTGVSPKDYDPPRKSPPPGTGASSSGTSADPSAKSSTDAGQSTRSSPGSGASESNVSRGVFGSSAHQSSGHSGGGSGGGE